jgi:opacity protein-like surface antigen
MRKTTLVLLLVLVMTLSVGAFAFQNEPDGFRRLSFGGLIGRYRNFGELKDYLVLSSTFWRADLGFEGEEMRGLIVEYAITRNFKLRGEWSTSNTQINVKDGKGWTGYKAEYNLNVNASTVSGIYTFTPEKALSYYIGAGLGQFKTNFQWDEIISIRASPRWWSRGEERDLSSFKS